MNPSTASRGPALVAALLVALSLARGPAVARADSEAGEALAKQVVADNCGRCHGRDGRTKVESWPNLNCQHRGYLYARLLAFRENDEHDIDKRVQSLSLEQIEALASYYATLDCPRP